MAASRSEFEKFDNAMNKILSVSHDELKRREEEWKRERAKNKRAKKPASSRASGAKRRDSVD